MIQIGTRRSLGENRDEARERHHARELARGIFRLCRRKCRAPQTHAALDSAAIMSCLQEIPA